MRETILLVTYDELRVLFEGRKINSFYGINIKPQSLMKSDVIHILHGLANRKLIIAEKDRFRINSPYDGWFDCIGHPKEVYRLCGHSMKKQECFCYQNDEWGIVTDRAEHRKDVLRIRAFRQDELKSWIKEEGYQKELLIGRAILGEIL